MELRNKLQLRGFEEEEIACVLDRLQAQGYVDDRKAAESFVSERRARGGYGPRLLEADLKRRGVGGEVIADFQATMSAEKELAAAREAAQKQLKRRNMTKEQLARYLHRRGFNSHAILDLLAGQLPE